MSLRMKSASSSEVSPVREAVRSLRGAFIAVGAFSAVINVLYLTSSIYMIQVYDRVLMSRSVPTLVALSILAVGLFVLQGLLETVRGRLLVRVGGRLDEALGGRVYKAFLAMPPRGGRSEESLQPVRDLDTARSFIAGMGPVAILDMPWMPFFLIFIFILHPALGWFAVFGGATLVALTWLTERLTHAPTRRAGGLGGRRLNMAEMTRRNAEAVRAMGFVDRMTARWLVANAAYRDVQHDATDVHVALSTASKVMRLVLQSGILGLGAWLVVRGEVSAGAIFASNIAMTRALAPIDGAIANWKSFILFREASARLEKLLQPEGDHPAPMPLPPPMRELAVEGLHAGPPGSRTPFVRAVSFKLRAGQGLGVIGPSASGKSTLVRALVGAWPLMAGEVRLDGATTDQWSPEALGAHVGYLPQDVELLEGTVAENIARFAEAPDPAAVIAAAQAAGIHEMILAMPDGYDTQIGEGAFMPSGGQRQRIGLARALYGDPFLVVLDEPNSNLDVAGDAALQTALAGVRARGGIAVVVAHRPSALASLDMVAVMAEGRLSQFGTREEILPTVLPGPAAGRARAVDLVRGGGAA